jgi:hypothetical protein
LDVVDGDAARCEVDGQAARLGNLADGFLFLSSSGCNLSIGNFALLDSFVLLNPCLPVSIVIN